MKLLFKYITLFLLFVSSLVGSTLIDSFPSPANSLGGQITLNSNSQVNGTTNNTIVSQSWLNNGGLCDGAACVLSNSLAPNYAFTLDTGTAVDGWATANTTYGTNKEFAGISLNPGESITFENDITVKIQGSFDINGNSSSGQKGILNINGHVIIHVGTFNQNSFTQININNGSSLKIIANYVNLDALSVITPSDFICLSNNELNVNTGVQLQGLLYTNGFMMLNQDVILTGAATANQMTLNSNAVINYDLGTLTSTNYVNDYCVTSTGSTGLLELGDLPTTQVNGEGVFTYPNRILPGYNPVDVIVAHSSGNHSTSTTAIDSGGRQQSWIDENLPASGSAIYVNPSSGTTTTVTYNFSQPTGNIDLLLLDVDEEDTLSITAKDSSGNTITDFTGWRYRSGDLSIWQNPDPLAAPPSWNASTQTITSTDTNNDHRSFALLTPDTLVTQIIVSFSVPAVTGRHIYTTLHSTTLGRDGETCSSALPFNCQDQSFVNYVTSGTFLTGEEHLASVNLQTGTQLADAQVNGLIGVTSLGYNVKDNLLWGYNMANKKIVRIDANYNSTIYNVAGMIDEIYSGGDVNQDGILHLSVNQNFYNNIANTLQIDRIDLNTPTPTKLTPLTINTGIDALDVAFNPLDNNLYFIASDGRFYRILITNAGTTGTIELVGDTGLGVIYNVVSYFDKDGNFYFNTDTTQIYQLKFSGTTISSVIAFSTLNTPLTQGDGAMCANASIAPPTTPTTSCGQVATSIMPSGDKNHANNDASVVSFAYDHRGEIGDFPTPTTLATASEVGTVWGKAYNANDKKLYTAAFLRRHADLSPDGLGAIYEIDVETQTPTLWMDLSSTTHLGATATLFPNETTANRGLSSPFAPSHDVWAYSRVAKEGIGGLDLSDDFTKMYAMDITNRQVLEIDTATKTVSNRYTVNDPGCAGGANDVRPFGVDYLNGNVYIGVTCSGETNKNEDDVDAHVMRLDGSTFTSVVNGATGFRWKGYWDDDTYTYGSSCTNFTYGFQNAYVPLITNIEIDESNNMVIGVTSRNGWRFAEGNYAPDTACNNLLTGHTSRGFILHATPSGSNWVLSADETWNTDNGDEQHHYKDGIYAHWGAGASQTFVGGLAKTNCSGEEVVLGNLMDPLSYESSGTRFIRTSDAQHETATAVGDTSMTTSKASTTELYQGAGSSWEKSSGIGDIEYLNVPSTNNSCDGKTYGINYQTSNNYSAIHEITSIGTTSNSMTTTLLKNDAFPFNSISLTKGLDNKLYAVNNTILTTGQTTPIYVYDPSTPSVQATNTGISLPYPGKDLWWISGGLDPAGNLYFLLKDGSYLAKVNLTTSTVTTVWSTWPTTTVQAPGGENFGELSVSLSPPKTVYYDITFDSSGDAIITDADGHYVWKVTNINTSSVIAYQGSLNGMTSISDPQWIDDNGTIRLFGSDANTPDGTHYIDTNTWNTTKVGTTSFYDMASCDFNTLTPPPVAPMEPFTCDETLYLSNRNILGTGAEDSGKTWLHSVDRNATPHTYPTIGSEYVSAADGYNALGYNVEDNFMYALDGNNLLKIDKNSVVENLGVVTGLPAQQLYAGEFDRDGNYYVSGTGVDSPFLYQIDINSTSVVNTIIMSSGSKPTAVRFWDIAIDETGDNFYAMLIDDGDVDSDYNNDTLAKINKNTGVITSIGTNKSGMSSYISLVFSDIEGKLFMVSNENGFYHVDSSTGEMYNIAATQDLTLYNDGTSCPDANISVPLVITIDSSVIDYEGDSGFKNFTFNIQLNQPAAAGSGFSYTVTDGTATTADNDYISQSANIILAAGTTEANITVQVQGDTTMEEHENFYVTLHSPLNLNIINNTSVGVILNDDLVNFNVERPDSDTVDNNTQTRKEALYTQISGRDFNYAVVTYDKNMSKNLEVGIEDITVKVALLDFNNSGNLLYEDYLYFPSGSLQSRLPRLLPNDLAIATAHRDVRFSITYILDGNGSIVKGQYDNAVDYNAQVALYLENADHSRDNFSIRAETFNMELLDGTMLRKASSDGDSTSLRLAAGYNYNFKAQALNHLNNNTVDYNNSTSRILTFTDSSSCNDESNRSNSESLEDGENQETVFEHQNVGQYKLNMQDKTWTKVDFDKNITDCIVDDANSSSDGNSMSGCNIEANSQINIAFYPYQFDLNFSMQNLPESGHDDFLYMDNLSLNNHDHAIEFEGNITAQSADGVKTSNFTNSCAARDVLFSLDADTLSEDGMNQLLQTSKSTTRPRTPVKYSRLVRFNNESNNSLLDSNNTLDYISSDITVSSNKFLDENNGTSHLNLRYNINKHLSETINPVQITFNKLDVSSNASNSIANDTINMVSNSHIPVGTQMLNSDVRNFYFTQVVSDKRNYPTINFTETQFVRTPLNVDIFCDTNMSYCQQTNILANTDTSGLVRADQGWYPSLNHNELTDGQVLNLNTNKVTVTVNPESDINLTNGRHGVIINNFSSCTDTKESIKVEIVPNSALLYNSDESKAGRPEYTISCKNSSSSLSGIGKTGHLIENKANRKINNRLEW